MFVVRLEGIGVFGGEANLLKGCGSRTSTVEKCILLGVIHAIGVWISAGCRLCVVFAATEEK